MGGKCKDGHNIWKFCRRKQNNFRQKNCDELSFKCMTPRGGGYPIKCFIQKKYALNESLNWISCRQKENH